MSTRARSAGGWHAPKFGIDLPSLLLLGDSRRSLAVRFLLCCSCCGLAPAQCVENAIASAPVQTVRPCHAAALPRRDLGCGIFFSLSVQN